MSEARSSVRTARRRRSDHAQSPKALNALTHGMCLAMKAQLDAWKDDDECRLRRHSGAGDRAFCAGGDIRALYESGKAGTPYALDFYRDEYILNATIKHYPKPYIAMIHGIVMGGGVGVSVHGRYRVADETDAVRHARNRHRALSRCRRQLLPAADAQARSACISL